MVQPAQAEATLLAFASRWESMRALTKTEIVGVITGSQANFLAPKRPVPQMIAGKKKGRKKLVAFNVSQKRYASVQLGKSQLSGWRKQR